MNPDKKYMSQVSSSDNDIRFVPPAFMSTNIYEKLRLVLMIIIVI